MSPDSSLGAKMNLNSQLIDCGELGLQLSMSRLFETIPPERMGLNGEYDHSGLAKRVVLTFRQKIDPREWESIQVTQRGRVVVLMGTVSSQKILQRMVHLAMQVDGANFVETCGVSIREVTQPAYRNL